MAQKKKRPTAKERRNGLIINVLTLIVLILLVFEGKSLISLFSSQTIQDRIRQEESEVFAGANLTEKQTEIGCPMEGRLFCLFFMAAFFRGK